MPNSKMAFIDCVGQSVPGTREEMLVCRLQQQGSKTTCLRFVSPDILEELLEEFWDDMVVDIRVLHPILSAQQPAAKRPCKTKYIPVITGTWGFRISSQQGRP